MITLHWLYALAGAMFAAFALLSALDRANPKRFGNAAFWGLMALSLLGGDRIAITNLSPCRVHQIGAALHPRDHRFIEQVFRLGM